MIDPLTVTAYDALGPDAALDLVSPVCASPQWQAAVIAGRPYRSLDDLIAASAAALAHLPWSEIETALAAHPRIGQRAAGADREAAWSRQEQAAAGAPDEEIARALRLANIAYEDRFGQVFLICATGRSSREVLAAINERLDNDVETERRSVRGELAAIVALRLRKTLR